MMRRGAEPRRSPTAAVVLWVATLAAPAAAHDELADGVGFAAGLFHPVLGLDHLLAMLCVGALSAQIGGRAIWYVPAMFVAAMVGGGLLGLQGVPLPAVEAAIALSVLVLGGALAVERLIPPWLALLSVAFFGLFHGHAHGTEMPVIANPWLYGLGFVIGTATIHGCGVLLGFAARPWRRGPHVLRGAGCLIAAVGAWLLLT